MLSEADLGAQLVVCGDHSADRGSGTVPAYLAHHLRAAQALGLVEVEADGPGRVLAVRRLDGGRRERLAVAGPAVLSVEGSVAELRRAPLAASLAAQGGTVEVRSGRIEHHVEPPRLRPWRPRARVLAPPEGTHALDRVVQLTGALVDRTPPRTLELDPPEAADAIIEQLRTWGYLALMLLHDLAWPEVPDGVDPGRSRSAAASSTARTSRSTPTPASPRPAPRPWPTGATTWWWRPRSGSGPRASTRTSPAPCPSAPWRWRRCWWNWCAPRCRRSGSSRPAPFVGVVLVNGHGGNVEAVARAAALLGDEGRAVLVWHPHVPDGDSHAGRTETSLLLHLAPGAVRMERARAGSTARWREIGDVVRAEGLAAVTPNGVLGDPTAATAREGEGLLAGLADRLCAAVAAWRATLDR